MSPSHRVALVSAFPPGHRTLNEYGYHLAREFAAREDVSELIVIADRLDHAAEELDLGPKVRVERVWSFNSLLAGPRILRAIREIAPDGVVWNLQTAAFGDREIPAALGLMAPAGARLLGWHSGVIAHNVISCIDLENTELKGQRLRQALVALGGRFVTRALMSASYLTVTLRSYRDRLFADHPRARLFHVPHGTFDAETGAVARLADRPRRIVTMGKFGTYKRLETLLAAFDLLRSDAEFADLELVVGGADHPATPGYLAGLAEARSADPAVRFHGYVEEGDVPAFFGAARLSVFDYCATTGSSGVLHQTASYGAVPVFPRIGDFVDVCEDEGIGGAHYVAMDHEAMATAMAKMLRDVAQAQEIADANLVAAKGMPLSEVARFHVDRLRRPRVHGDSTPTEPA